MLRFILGFMMVCFLSLQTILASEIVEVSPLTKHILLLHFSDGYVDHFDLGDNIGDGVLYNYPLDINAATSTSNFSISSMDDGNYQSPISPNSINRKSKGSDFYANWNTPDYVSDHWLYLHLPHPLQNNKSYTINLGSLASNQSEVKFIYNDQTSRSESVHVNNLGYLPDARLKYGYVSAWIGDGGPLNLDDYDGANFDLIDLNTLNSVFTGAVALRKDLETGYDDNAYGANYTRADVWECDFSNFQTPGDYVLSVAGMGCSFPFKIDENIYQEAFYTTTRGLYHQRSGIALTQPYTKWERARDFHPEAGDTVFLSSWRYMDGGNAFEQLPQNATGEYRLYWGGWHDAADWDRNANHLKVAHALLMAFEANPAKFSDGELNIPESGNGLPDIIDESLWVVDFFKQLQEPDGGVHGGLETTGHPLEGESSVSSNDVWYAYAPDPDATFHYAAVASQMAFCLTLIGENTLAADYETSAIAAYDWAIQNTATNEYDGLRDQRHYAAAWMFKQTGNVVYQTQFMSDNLITTPTTPLYQWQSHLQTKAAWAYATTNQSNIDNDLKNTIISAVSNWAMIDNVNSAQDRSGRMGYHWWQPTGYGVSTTPNNLPLLGATMVDSDLVFVDYQQTTCDYFLGANPLNMTWVTQMGDRHPSDIMHIDSWFYHDDKGMVPGIVPYGMDAFDEWMPYNSWAFFRASYGWNTCYPNVEIWPEHELWFENRHCPGTGEFTVHENIGIAAASYAALKRNADANISPSIVLTSPSNLSIFNDAGQVNFTVNTEDLDGTVTEVSYYANGNLIGTGNSSSNFSFTWTSMPSNYYTITAKAIDNEGASTQSAPINMHIESANIATTAQMKIQLQGAFNTSSNSMSNALQTANLLPEIQPYNTAPWWYNGNEIISNFNSLSNNIVDWVLVELRHENDRNMLVAQKAALLQTDGLIRDIDNANAVNFEGVAAGNYFVVVRHRNHLAVISNTTTTLPHNTGTHYDFSTSNNMAYGLNQMTQLANGSYALKSGDLDGNGVVNVSDFNIYANQSSAINAYLAGDLDVQGDITINDYNLYVPNASAIGVTYIRY